MDIFDLGQDKDKCRALVNKLTFKSLAVTLRTTRFKIKKFRILIAFMCFVWISEQTETFALYYNNWLVFITVVESDYSAIRTESLYNTDTIRL